MNKRLQQIQNWPERAQLANWCAATLAKNCGVSLRTLERHFLQETGKSPKTWLMEQRNQNAKKMLEDGLSIKQTAGNLGYEHCSNFSRDYKEFWGCCPAEVVSRQQTRP